MRRPFLASVTAACLFLTASAHAQETGTPSILDGLTLTDGGDVALYEAEGRVVLGLSPAVIGRYFLWNIEVVGLPADVVAADINVTSRLGRIEREGDTILIRDLTRAAANRPAVEPDLPMEPGDLPSGLPVGDSSAGPLEMSDPKSAPIAAAIGLTQTGPIVAALPIAGTAEDGTVYVDMTALFAGDVGGLSAGNYAALTGLLPAGVDPSRSRVDDAFASEFTLTVRSEVTFLGANPASPASGLSPVTLMLGHSWRFLPTEPMAPRFADPRVGYFTTSFTEFETLDSRAQESRAVIARFRLEKADPAAEVSEPVEPITFWIGPGVPERWRAAIAAGVLAWNPVFEAAGFRNALRVEQAPSPAEDPDWAVEDVSRNVIRWLPVRFPNAMGPHVVDPRSGETLASHVLIWPGVIDWFEMYYYAVFGTVDPRAATLPLPEDLRAELMTYIVAHEVGHALGLRHNHIASTAWSVEQMRDPAFANANGPNSSIMAYGRFNQVAQPGDGITQFWSVIGPYDYAAIRWGYGDFPDQAALDAFAASFAADRALWWGAGEMAAELGDDFFDPRVVMENNGAERIEATRLATANTLRSLAQLHVAAGGDDRLFRATHDVILSTHFGYLNSVARLVAGTERAFAPGDGPRVMRIPPDAQRAAVAYLLGEGARTLDAFRAPEVIERQAVAGGATAIDLVQARLVSTLLTGPKLALLDSQSQLYPGAYSAADLGADVLAAVWGDLSDDSRTARVLRQGWIATHAGLLSSWATAAQTEPAGMAMGAAEGVPQPVMSVLAETGDSTLYRPWMRVALPDLLASVTAAAEAAEGDARLHLVEMESELRTLIAMLG